MADGEKPQKLSRRNFLKAAGVGSAAFMALGLPQPTRADDARTLPDAELLDLVQKQTLKYFIDYAHPVSGMARECSNEKTVFGKDIVTVGGTGFGIMGMIAGASRGWLTRKEVLGRVAKIADFLKTADQYHGIFPHWLNGETGKVFVYPKSRDDGADLVETSFLMMGLLTARQYFSGNTPEETKLRENINMLWQKADWQWHTQNGKKKELYWHWSPTNEWAMNLPVQGWNECLITHVLAASSPTHAVSPDVYHESWTKGRDFKTGRSYDGIELPLGPAGGGPLFMSHYSFLGLSPVGLKDKAADYWVQNKNHALVNRAHCIRNPHGYKGYGPKCWGLTSSMNDNGYSDHSPVNDRGVIAPTAALSSFPYTPEYSMEVLRHLYEDHPRDKIWGEYGFYDAFKADATWYSKHYLAIDQGPIVAMIENHRSGLLWSLFMGCPEIKAGLKKLGFESPYFSKANPFAGADAQNAVAGDAPALLDKLCGPMGIKPLSDAEFAAVIGLDGNGEWQATQFRRGLRVMTAPQQRALLKHVGYTDETEMAKACVVLSAKAPSYSHDRK